MEYKIITGYTREYKGNTRKIKGITRGYGEFTGADIMGLYTS